MISWLDWCCCFFLTTVSTRLNGQLVHGVGQVTKRTPHAVHTWNPLNKAFTTIETVQNMSKNKVSSILEVALLVLSDFRCNPLSPSSLTKLRNKTTSNKDTNKIVSLSICSLCSPSKNIQGPQPSKLYLVALRKQKRSPNCKYYICHFGQIGHGLLFFI